jgi:LPXTG-motif cell wall-anchored protein
MGNKATTPERRGGCWHPFIAFIDILIAIPSALWLLDKESHPWNLLLVALILLLMLLLYFRQRRKSRSTRDSLNDAYLPMD